MDSTSDNEGSIMTLPKNPYTILELKALWAEENVDVEKCLQKGILKASIKLNPTQLIRCKKNEAGKETLSKCSVRKGLFEIENYRKIVWTENSNHGLLCDFSARKVRISRKNYIFAFWGLNRDDVTTGYSNRVIRYSEILITAEEVERFKLKYGLTAIHHSDNELAPPASSLELNSPINQIDEDLCIRTDNSESILLNAVGLPDYVAKCRKDGEADDQIVFNLMRDYGQSKKYSKPNTIRLSALAIGIAIFPNRNCESNLEKDALERYVWRKVQSCHNKVTL